MAQDISQTAWPQWAQTRYQALSTDDEPDALAACRRNAWHEAQQAGLPHHDERWKYANLTFLQRSDWQSSAPKIDPHAVQTAVANYRKQYQPHCLLVLLDGALDPHYSDSNDFPYGLTVATSDTMAETYQHLLSAEKAHHQGVAHLNNALTKVGTVIALDQTCQISEPIHLLYLTTRANTSHSTLALQLAAGASVKLVQQFISLTDEPTLQTTVTHASLAQDASLHFLKIQDESFKAHHIAHHFIHQAENSSFEFQNFSLGCAFSRDECAVNLAGAHASAVCSGFYLTQSPNQYVDQHIDIYHRHIQTQSEMFFKGVGAAKSRAVFNGRLYVAKDAQKTNAYQANHNLLLSPSAEVYSKPELEIYADDVKCKHGATIGQLNEAALFYLCSRGIKQEEATQLLLEGFVQEIVTRVQDDSLRQHIQKKVMNYGKLSPST